MITDVNNEGKAELIHLKAMDAQQRIIGFLNNHKVSEICYAQKSRVKTESDLIEKVKRKKIDKLEYSLDSITDVIGVRFVVLFKKDIVETVREIISILLEKEDDKNPFKNCAITEAIYYIGDVSSSNITPDLEDCFHNIGKEFRVQEIKEGYSSFHIVCHLEPKLGSANSSGYRIPVEIQVRTVFEDAWGEIDHRHRYGVSKNRDSLGHPTLSQHLSTLKKFVDACVDYADIIVEESRIEINPKDSSKILDNPKDIEDLRFFFGDDIEIEYTDRYMELVKEREGALNNGSYLELLSCAQKFLDLRNNYLENTRIEVFDSFAFNCCTNEALCHLSVKKEVNISLAKKLYLFLYELDKENCLVLMRLGQALAKSGEVDRGITRLKDAFSLAKVNDSKFPVKKSDIDYVLSKAPKIIGYYIWLKIGGLEDFADDNVVLPMYKEAYEYTKKGLSYIDDQGDDFVEYTNNLLFYLTEIYKRIGTSEYKLLLTSELETLESRNSNFNKVEAKTLDTFLNAYMALKNLNKSLLVAQALENKIFNKDYDFDNEYAIKILETIKNLRKNS